MAYCSQKVKNTPITDLMLLIRQDVDRTIPEVAFFQSEKIRTMMCNILFIHAKIDPGLCYKQGMHEILGRYRNHKLFYIKFMSIFDT